VTTGPVRVRFTPEALADLREALAWYDRAEPPQSDAFSDRLSAVITLIRDRPRAYARTEGAVRRAVLNPFPYSLYYRVELTQVRILLLDDDRRDPAHRSSRFA
jgi:plasmid stabilization system protein ParE